jgi:hypothetical protein
MSNLTITVAPEVLKRARLRALTEGVSVNELLRRYLEAYAGVSAEQTTALDSLLELSHRARSHHRGTKRWSRDELHERR